MSINLIESEHRTQRRFGGTIVSVAVHACIISLAAYASASAGEVLVTSPIDTVTVFYPRTPTKVSVPGESATRRSENGSPKIPKTPDRFVFDRVHISDSLPPVDPAAPTIDDNTLFNTSTDAGGRRPGDGIADGGGESGEPLFAAQVEKPAMPRNGNPSPKYPSVLESSRVEGAVLVQFVVDTLGVADMSTFKVLDATNDLFAASTRATLSKWRFYPAEASGRKVRQFVQLPLKFVAPHR